MDQDWRYQLNEIGELRQLDPLQTKNNGRSLQEHFEMLSSLHEHVILEEHRQNPNAVIGTP